MEDVKLEFPSLPQCKEDAEVSLPSDCHAQAYPCGSRLRGDPRPQPSKLPALEEPCCLLRASRDLRVEPPSRGGGVQWGVCVWALTLAQEFLFPS